MGDRILYLDTAGEFGGVMKSFTGVAVGGNVSLGYFDAKVDWNIDIRSSEHTLPSTKRTWWFQHN